MQLVRSWPASLATSLCPAGISCKPLPGQPILARMGRMSGFCSGVHWRKNAAFSVSSLASSSFTNHLRSLPVIAYSDEGAMAQVPAIRPLDESVLADELRSDPAALLHLLCGQRFSPSRSSLLGQILEGALDSLQRLKSREDLVPNSRDKAVLHLCGEHELLAFVNAHEQRIKPTCAGNVTADDELCSKFARSLIQAPDRSPGS